MADRVMKATAADIAATRKDAVTQSEDSASLPPDKALARIEHYIKAPPQNSRVFEITAEMAEQLLEKYSPPGTNRKKKPMAIQKYADDMLAGEWDLNGTTIVFSDKKVLRDGQNRLMACVKADVSFKTHLVFGVPDEMFWRMDRGKNRNAADALYVGNYKEHPTQLAQAGRWLKMFQENSVKKRLSYEPIEIKATVEANPSLDNEFVRAGMEVGKKWNQPSGLMAALFVMWNDKHPELFRALLLALSSNQKIPERFRAIDKALAAIKKQAIDSAGRVHDVWRAAVLVKGWNLVIEGRKGKGRFARSDFAFDAKEDPFPLFS